MKDKIRCKACGYIMEKDALADVCPACGVKKEMFEPWEDKVGALRRMILEKDIHPVIVHAPQGLAFFLLGLSVLFPLFGASIRDQYIWPALVVMSWLLPLTVFVSFLSGLFDAKVRFRKLTTPILIQKQIFGALFFVISSVLTVLISVGTFKDLTIWISYLVASALALGCSSILGLIGAKLIIAAMPGDKILLGGKKKKPAAKAAPAKTPTEEKKE